MTKTAQMEVMELKDPQGRGIRQIMADAFRDGRGIIGGAKLLGISPSTYQGWINAADGRIEKELVFDEDGALAAVGAQDEAA